MPMGAMPHRSERANIAAQRLTPLFCGDLDVGIASVSHRYCVGAALVSGEG